MSIASLISQFGAPLTVKRPTVSVASDGQTVRTLATVGSAVSGWFQPSAQIDEVHEGRAVTRTNGTIYFAGLVELQIEDELWDDSTPARTWRVTGRVSPGSVTTGAMAMTAVEAVEVLA